MSLEELAKILGATNATNGSAWHNLTPLITRARVRVSGLIEAILSASKESARLDQVAKEDYLYFAVWRNMEDDKQLKRILKQDPTELCKRQTQK